MAHPEKLAHDFPVSTAWGLHRVEVRAVEWRRTTLNENMGKFHGGKRLFRLSGRLSKVQSLSAVRSPAHENRCPHHQDRTRKRPVRSGQVAIAADSGRLARVGLGGACKVGARDSRGDYRSRGV